LFTGQTDYANRDEFSQHRNVEIFLHRNLSITDSKIRYLQHLEDGRVAERNKIDAAEFTKALQELTEAIGPETSPKAAMNLQIDAALKREFQRACGKRPVTRVISGLMRFYIKLQNSTKQKG
jgi:hypothetical protein